MLNANLYGSYEPGEGRQPVRTSLGNIFIRVEEMEVASVGGALDKAEPREDEWVLN